MNNTTPYSRTMNGLTDIVADSITTETLVLDSLTAQDIVCNTLSAATYVDTPLLQGSGNLNMTYVGGIYSNSPEYNIDTTGGYGGIAFTSQFDVDLQPLTGKINLIGKVNQSTGTRNVSYGLDSMNGTQTGSDNTSFGNGSSKVLTSGIKNTSLGSLSLNSNNIYNNNVAIGYNALNKVTSSANTAVGSEALANLSTANATVAVGFNALNALTTGTVNSAFGFRCLEFSNGDANTGTGSQALRYLTTGLHNTSTGFVADYLLTTGSFNTTFGSSSGCVNASYGANNANSCFGYVATTSGGSYNTYLGFGANYVSPIATNYSSALGAYATPTASNQIMLGTATEYVQCPNYLNATNYITTATQTPGTNNTRVATTAFVQTAVSSGSSSLLASANAWTGNTNTFNSFLPTSTLAPTTGNQFTNKTYVDGAISGISGFASLTGANAFTGNTNTFNSFLPTSTISATTANELTNKTYVDGAITTAISGISGYASLSGANAFTGNTNTFNSFLPTSTLAPTTGNQLTNKTYVDTKGGLTTANAWTGNTNTFNSFLPTSTLAPTTGNQLTNKTYVDTAITNIDAYDKTMTIVDDFLTGLTHNPVDWDNTITGSGTGAVQTSLVNHPGLFRLGTSTTVGSSSGLAMNQSSIFTNNILTVEWIWRYNTNFNNSVIQVGYATGVNSFGVSAVFRLQISPGNYQFVVNGTSFYTINKEAALLGLLVGKWLHGKIIIDFSAGTQAFQLTNLTDGVTESETQTASITSGAITPVCKISQLGATASTMDVDYSRFTHSSTRV